MHCLVVNVRGSRLRDVETVVPSFWRLSEVLLLVTDEVFGACLHSSTLNTLDRVGKQFTS